MKGIKGERRAHGITSRLHVMLDDMGLGYQGTRIGRDSKKPWIMYQSEKGAPVDLEALDTKLLKQGFTHYQGCDDEPETFPQHGVPGRGQRYTCLLYTSPSPRDRG